MGPLTLLLAALLLPPQPAARLAGAVTGADSEALVRICHRESNCQPITVHERDAWVSRASWRGQVALGHLDPECQPYVPRWWATVGSMGLNAADHWRYLPACYPPYVFAIPLVSAFVAAQKWNARCRPGDWPRWCGTKRRRNG